MRNKKPGPQSRLSTAGAIAPAPNKPAQIAPDLTTIIGQVMTALAEQIRRHGREGC